MWGGGGKVVNQELSAMIDTQNRAREAENGEAVQECEGHLGGQLSGRRQWKGDPGKHHGESVIEIMIIIKPPPLAIVPNVLPKVKATKNCNDLGKTPLQTSEASKPCQ